MTPSFLPGGLPLSYIPPCTISVILLAPCDTSHRVRMLYKNEGHVTPWIIITLHTCDTPFRLSIVPPKRESLDSPTAFVCYPDRSVPFTHSKGANVGTSSFTLTLSQ